MTKFRSRNVAARWLAASVSPVLILASSAYSQAPASASNASSTDEVEKLEKFVVTGSYLPGTAGVLASPVVMVEGSTIAQTGATDTLRLLRQTTPLFLGSGNQGTETNNGAAGESYIALRNLTTLVLINGQRVTTSPFSNGVSVDVNTIPTAMIDRIEIVKDGASTVYGSDAIGGVVNIILKKDYNGFTTGGRFGSTKNGDYKTRDVYIVAGASGNGYSLSVGAQHFENTTLVTTDRRIATLTPADEAALGFYPTSSVFSGTYPGRVGSNVLAGSTLIATGAPGFNANITSPGMKTSPTDAPKTMAELVAAGIYIPVSSTPAGQAAGGATALNTTLFGNPLIVGTKRNQFVANGTKDLFGKNLQAFGDFLYAQTKNGGSGLAPAPVAGVGPAGGNTLFIPANNPYNVFNVDFPGPLSARTRLIELGRRRSENETNTWRFVGGLKGQLGENYSWEATFNYSSASLVQRILGGANGFNMNQAMIPLLSPTGGYVYNSAGKPLSTLLDASGNNLPVYNFFALPGFNDTATLNAIRTTLFQTGETSLRNVQFIVRGKPLELPAGQLSFAAGVEARSENLAAGVDALFANGLALGYNQANAFSGGSRRSSGVFAELYIPVTSAKMGMTGLHTLDVTIADRYEKIKPGGTPNSPKVTLRWLPIDDQLVFRATYAKGFIAPTIFDLFGPTTGNSPTFSILEGDGSSSSGGSTGKSVTIQGTTNELSNPRLPASTSASYTTGIVYSPKQVKGLTLSLDYYWIQQRGGVGTTDYTAAVADLNAKGSGSAFASGFTFADNTKLTSTASNQVTSTNFGSLNILKNFTGTQWTNGLDFNADYFLNTDAAGRFHLGVAANLLFNYRARANPSSPFYQYARNFTNQTNSLGNTNGLLPGYVIKPYVTHTYGAFTTAAFLNYLPATTASGSIFGHSPKEIDPSTGSPYVNTDTISGKPARIPAYFTMDVSVSYAVPSFGRDWLRNLTATVGVNNAFNKKPPYVPVDGNPPGENNTVQSTYDIIGRMFFAELRKQF